MDLSKSGKFWCTCEDHQLIIKFNEFLNNNAVSHKRTYFAIKARLQKIFFTKNKETKSIGINCNMDDEDLFNQLYPWLAV